LALDRVKGLVVPMGAVLGLEHKGWSRGPVLDRTVEWLVRPLPGGRQEIRLGLVPGFFTSQILETPEEQTLGSVTLNRPGSWGHDGALPWSRLDTITFSELVRDLEGLR